MLITPPLPARRPRKTVPPPAPPTLVAAALLVDPGTGDASVRLTFDRAIDVSNLVPSQITVDDAAGAGWAYAGSAVSSLPDPRSVVITLVTTGPAEGPTVLNATAATGITAADGAGGGGTWAGVDGVELPFG